MFLQPDAEEEPAAHAEDDNDNDAGDNDDNSDASTVVYQPATEDVSVDDNDDAGDLLGSDE